MPKVFVFGNPLVGRDSLCLKLLPELIKEFPSIEFMEFDSAEDLHTQGRELNIIDVIEGIERVQIFTDLNAFSRYRILSLHDFDLGWELALLNKMGLIEKIRIFAVPVSYGKQRALKELIPLLKSTLLAESG